MARRRIARAAGERERRLGGARRASGRPLEVDGFDAQPARFASPRRSYASVMNVPEDTSLPPALHSPVSGRNGPYTGTSAQIVSAYRFAPGRIVRSRRSWPRSWNTSSGTGPKLNVSVRSSAERISESRR